MPSPTPYLALDLFEVERQLLLLSAALPTTRLHYAVKANPSPEVLDIVAAQGHSFDVASPGEVRDAVAAGGIARDLVYTNPVKARPDIRAARALGVQTFVVDSSLEVDKLAEEAPGCRVLARLATSGKGSDWPLSHKFGAPPSEVVPLLRRAVEQGLRPAGVSFHVGSQQHDPGAWDEPLNESAAVLRRLAALRPEEGWTVDLGGGFPAQVGRPSPPLRVYGQCIEAALTRAFGADRPQTIAEPGRVVVADAGTLVATVTAVVHRGGRRWVHLDAGVFTGLVETLDDAITYPLTTTADGGPVGPAVLAGPSCDSADVMYAAHGVALPLALREGDQVAFGAAGAYTTAYTTMFNGFAPLVTELRTRAERAVG